MNYPSYIIMLSIKNIQWLLLLILLIIGWLYYLQITEEHFGNIKNTDQKVLNEIIQMLKVTDKILLRNRILYWIDGGTLLGAVRHSGIIPWDDDADICIAKENENRFYNLKREFNRLGYDISRFLCGYKIFPIGGQHIPGKVYKFPFIDVFIVDKFNDKYTYVSERCRKIWPNAYNKINDLFPLKRVKFNNITLNSPNNPISYLDRYYGNWRKVAYKNYDHSKEQIIQSVTMQL